VGGGPRRGQAEARQDAITTAASAASNTTEANSVDDESMVASDVGSPITRSKRKRSSAAVGKEKNDQNRDNERGAETVERKMMEDDERVVAVEWPLSRVLSLRISRMCIALGGKAVAPPPAVKVPRALRVLVIRIGRGGVGTGRGGGSDASAGSLDKIVRAAQQIAALPRDNDGRVVFPVGFVHGVMPEDLGVVQSPRLQGFSSAAYILPVGYKSTRQYLRYLRCDDPDGPRTRWVQEMIQGDRGAGPVFRLSADEGAWAEVLRRVTAAREAKGEEVKKTAISGPEFFGYSLPHVRLLIEELPGAAPCTD